MTYQYKCDECGVFEIECSITEYKSTAKCPKCGKRCSRDFSDYKPSVQLTSGMYGIDKQGGWNV